MQVLNKTKNKKSILAQNIIMGRRKMGLSAEKFAEVAGIPYPTLRDIEADKNHGRPATHEKIAQALNLEVHELHKPMKDEEPNAVLSILNRHILELQAELKKAKSDDVLFAYSEARPDIQKKVRQLLGLEARDSEASSSVRAKTPKR